MMVSTLLEGVSDRQRQALLLRYITQLTIPEIAVVMGCAEGTVKATLHSALTKASLQSKETTNVTE
jgi:RNA polymerase sigma factor (sigma-70 family)